MIRGERALAEEDESRRERGRPSRRGEDRGLVVTIDGPAGAGKSTVARRVAQALGLPYLDSGAIYRALTLDGLEAGLRFEQRGLMLDRIAQLELEFVPGEGDQVRTLLRGRDVTQAIREPRVAEAIHQVAAVPEYRQALIDFQRRFARERGLVTEGRDMGSVIFPAADRKFYLDASAEERARRRHADYVRAGREAGFNEVLQDILLRDQKDRDRAHAPLSIPEGAIVVCSDNLSIEAVVEHILAAIRGESR